MTKIALIEDDADIAFTVRLNLERENYRVAHYADGHEGLVAVQGGGFDFVILDLNLPDVDGLTICRELRRDPITTSIPILMLTARGQVEDKVLGLKIGADDYLTKPFDMLELLARVEAMLRRPATSGAPVHQVGSLRVDFRSTEVSREGEALLLSAREYQLLCYFLEHRGATLSRQQLLNEVWGYRAVQSTRTVDVHVASLRQKIEADLKNPQLILTIHGLGYKFAA